MFAIVLDNFEKFITTWKLSIYGFFWFLFSLIPAFEYLFDEMIHHQACNFIKKRLKHKNMEKYESEKLRIWTLFMQWIFHFKSPVLICSSIEYQFRMTNLILWDHFNIIWNIMLELSFPAKLNKDQIRNALGFYGF